ncbi:MAG: hypothetical protein AAFX53_11765 [Bacteroidota bacterium]
MEANADVLFEEAIQKLKEANTELHRPEEDVVASLVCSNAQHAIQNYLEGFLVRNGVVPGEDETIDTLYAQCKKINTKFGEVSLSGFDCTAHKADSRFCNDFSKFSRCFDIADSLDTFLRREGIIDL